MRRFVSHCFLVGLLSLGGIAAHGDDNKPKGKTEVQAYDANGKQLVKDPSAFYSGNTRRLYSGPQPGEALPPLPVVVIGKNEGKETDFVAEANGKPMLLVLMDSADSGGKTSYFMGKLASGLRDNTKKQLAISIVYLGDDPEAIEKQAQGQRKYLPKELLLAYSRDGRDGPGSFGLNRNVPVTMIVAKDGKVLHNFAFPQHVFELDPHVAGAAAEVLEIDKPMLAGWLEDVEKSMMKKESVVMTWLGWAKTASREDIQSSLKSDKFLALSAKDQAAIRKGIKRLATK